MTIEEVKALKDQYYDADEDYKIPDLILSVPKEQWDAELVAGLVAAYNNTENYEKAIECSLENKDLCAENIIGWHYRIAWGYQHMEDYENALEHINEGLKLARETDPKHKNVEDLLDMLDEVTQAMEEQKYEDMLDPFFDELEDKTDREKVEIEIGEGTPGLMNSKFGGIPYIPAGGEWPVSRSTNEKLHHILQINFEEMPETELYPEKGILQLFLAATEDFDYGSNFENMADQDRWRLIYHEDISDPMSEEDIKAMVPEYDKESEALPLFDPEKAVPLSFKAGKMGMTFGDYRFLKVFQETAKATLPEEYQVDDYYDLPDAMSQFMIDTIYGNGSRVGGYPAFAQGDIRNIDEYSDYELLLQIDSEDDVIMWGDMGVANFFIREEDLKNRDFTKVLYNWECS